MRFRLRHEARHSAGFVAIPGWRRRAHLRSFIAGDVGSSYWDLETTVVCFSRLHRLVAEKNKMWNLGYPAVQKTVEGGVEVSKESSRQVTSVMPSMGFVGQ